MTTTPDSTEQAYFAALLDGDAATLRELLSEDFLLIDVLTGSEVQRDALIEPIGAGQLGFDQIERAEHRVRMYGPVAIITGRTDMHGRYLGQPFGARSRYTHVFVAEGERWRMVSAQGTQIAPSPATE